MPSEPSGQITHSISPAAPLLLPRYQLRVIEGPDAGLRVTSSSGRLVVGTSEKSDLRLTDSTVSRFHAELLVDAGSICVRDLGSRNGTRVNGVRVREGWVEPGVRLQVGESTALLEADAGTIEAPVSRAERFGSLVGRSVAMRQTFAALERSSASQATVLLLGETGTGKEAAAESLHAAGPRKDGPFIVVDCASLPANLLESELFGHTRGAFTGADRDRDGAMAAADGGTLFFDEIGELPPELQPKLLRALERREVKRVGGTHFRPVDVRIIAATHRDLRAEVNARRFRQDLYYRLAVVEIRLPSLRERLDDLPALVDALAERLGTDPEQRKKLIETPGLLAELQGHSWPGNVRELRNYLERGLTLGAWGHHPPAEPQPPGAVVVDPSIPLKEARVRWTLALERAYLEALLQRHDSNVSAAARAAQIDRMHLYRLLWRHGLK